MDTSIAMQINERLIAYLAGETTLHDFEDWFVPATWGRIGHSPAPEEALIGAIELRLAEYTNGHLSAQDVHEALARTVVRHTIGATPFLTGATTVFTRVAAAFRIAAPMEAGPQLVSAAGSW